MRTPDRRQDREPHPIGSCAAFDWPRADRPPERMGPLFDKLGQQRPARCTAGAVAASPALQVLRGFRSERGLMEEMRYNFGCAFTGFTGAGEPWGVTVFTKNRQAVFGR